MWMGILFECVPAAVAERGPHDLCQCSHCSLSSNGIGAAGARDLGVALQVNTMLTMLV
jgi:hypothetical protein